MPRAPPNRQLEEDTKPQKIPRPPNAWILYRTDRLREWRETRSPNDPPMKQADISRFISTTWKIEPDDIKLDYEKRAAIAKAEHKKKYPDYKYNPISKEVKDKMRAEEREAKKRAREEAKAARLAGRRISASSRIASASSRPSSSNVKLEVFDQIKPMPAPDPVNRGCGPSPPIDYDPESSSTSSTPLPSSSSSASRSSPFPSSSSHTLLSPPDPRNAWLHHGSSPTSSPPSQPPPSYPSTFVHSPMPSRHSSYNFSPAMAPSSVSTPSDSPPSYTEGEAWQPQPPDSGYHSFAPLPEFPGDWSTFSQYPPLLQPDIAFPAPAIDPLLVLHEGEQVNFDATAAGLVFDLTAAQPASAQSPPGELELQQLLQQIGPVNDGHTLNPRDQLGQMLDMAELHETMEDNVNETGISLPMDAQTITFEEFAAWVNAQPQGAMAFADPNFYFNMALQVTNAYPQLQPNMQPPPFSTQPDSTPVSGAVTPVPNVALDPATYQMFGFNAQQHHQPEIAMPVPVVPVAVQAIAQTSAPAQSAYPPSDNTYASGSRRYVPPSGACMPGRRRVAGKFHPRKSDFEGDSA